MNICGTHRLAAAMALVLVALAGCRPEVAEQSAPNSPPSVGVESNDPRDLLRDAGRWLWSRQHDDGSWRSEHYAVLRSGQAYTPVVLFTLLSIPEEACPRPPGGVEKALQFIRDHTNADGVLGMDDPELPEYPNYATAYALLCLAAVGNPQDVELIGRIQGYLIADQYGEENGFGTDTMAHGGWGFGGVRRPGDPGHMDLAHTRRVLQSLRHSGVTDQSVYGRARRFLLLVQRHPDSDRQQPTAGEDNSDSDTAGIAYDGGFYFSPVVLDANKGRLKPADGDSAAYYRSYATTTCDGVLSLLAAGVPADDQRVTSARRWLEDHPDLDYPQGIPRDHPDPWGAALHFYHLAVRAEAYQALRWPGDWRRSIVEELAPAQREDGSYENRTSPLMKEDDPILCTTLAATALVRCLD